MKYLFTFFLFIPVWAKGQLKENHIYMMDKFVSYYNGNEDDIIAAMFPEDSKDFVQNMLIPSIDMNKKSFGMISLYKYLGQPKEDPEPVHIFKLVYDTDSIKVMSFTLIENMQFGTFRLHTTSDEIVRMLAASE